MRDQRVFSVSEVLQLRFRGFAYARADGQKWHVFALDNPTDTRVRLVGPERSTDLPGLPKSVFRFEAQLELDLPAPARGTRGPTA